MSGRASTSKLRLYFQAESPSGKAVRMVDAPKAGDVKRSEWLPRSVLLHVSKFPKGTGHDYAQWEITLPAWLIEQKRLGDFQV